LMYLPVVAVFDALGELRGLAKLEGAVGLVLLHNRRQIDVVTHLVLGQGKARLCTRQQEIDGRLVDPPISKRSAVWW
jgi:hypothetical protein